MPAQDAPAWKLPPWAQILITFVLAFDIVALWQWADGAFESEFGGHEDEAVHYVDAVGRAGAAPTAQVADARNGNAAPVFNFALHDWTLAFGKSRVSVLLFTAALAAANATLIFAITCSAGGLLAATAATLAWLCAPIVRASAEMILPDQMRQLTLTATLAAWAATLDSPRPVSALITIVAGLAAIFAGLNALTIAAALILVPLLVANRSALRRWEIWLPAAVLAVAMVVRSRMVPWPPVAPEALAAVRELPLQLGIAVATFALAGTVLGPRFASNGRQQWAACIAIIAAVAAEAALFGHHTMDRTCLAASPALAMLAGIGASSIARATASLSTSEREFEKRRALFAVILLVLTLAPSMMSSWRKEWTGYGPAVDEILDQSGDAGILIVSDRRGEGALIAEATIRDLEGRLSVERGSEVLVEQESDASGKRRIQRFDDEALIKFLLGSKFEYIVLDSAVLYDGKTDYQDQMQRVLEDHPNQFWPVFATPVTRDGETRGRGLRVFRIVRRAAAGS